MVEVLIGFVAPLALGSDFDFFPIGGVSSLTSCALELLVHDATTSSLSATFLFLYNQNLRYKIKYIVLFLIATVDNY